MAREIDSAREPVPLSTQVGVSRQLRTEYSPAPEADEQRDGPLQALVIGDPGDPKKREDLPGARREALAVYELLKGAEDVEVTGLIGAPNADRGGIPRDVEPATLTRALNLMMHGRFDLLHYSGHGDFDPEDPTRVGWVFDIGMLTSREIQALDEVPSLIVANACLSGRTSRALEGGGDFRQARTEAGLLPSLADEFFHLGVRNYVGTSWEVNDEGAVRFAQRLYRELLADPRPSISEAVRAARAELYGARGAFGKLWAAYQHYGDPAARLRKG
jgi:CHAT domain-containing protein